jgi:hypothetical protein
MADIEAPIATFQVDQRFLIEPLGGPQEVNSYLDRFPDEVYNKSIDSHLVRFVYALLGPAGVGSVRRNYLEARLIFESRGLELFDLDRFYGSPLQFGRISDEVYIENVLGLLPQEEWEKIRSKDAKYRNRITDFISGARAGNTPLGMRLVARSGLGHEVEVIENYKSLFDQNSDDPLGLPFYGKTRFLNEMVVLPRQEVSVSEVQKISVLGGPTGGTFLIRNALGLATPPLPWNSTRQQVEIALINLFQAPQGNIQVSGGPLPQEPLIIRFLGVLGAQNLAQISVQSALTGGSNPQMLVTTTTQGFDAANEVVVIGPRDQFHLQEALDRIRPVSVIPTVVEAPGKQSSINWVRATASSEFDEMVRYVTGSGRVFWPERDSIHWIEGGVEHQALRAHGDLNYQYSAFHEVVEVDSYTETALTAVEYPTADWATVKVRFANNHIGRYDPDHAALFAFLRSIPDSSITTPDMILADYAEPLTIDRVVETPSGSIGLVNGVYPEDYRNLPGVPTVRYNTEQFWSSQERRTGDDYIELDLGAVRAINTISFETTRKPVDIDVDFDIGSTAAGERDFRPVSYTRNSSRQIFFSATELNPWLSVTLSFTNRLGQMIYTRYVRIKFTRREQGDFLASGTVPWSIDVRNLRIGRNVSNV